MTVKKCYLLYGSQTGNAESISKDFSELLSEKIGDECVCKCLNDVKTVDLKEIASIVLIVCSTTGNGDAPENAESWWRSVKLRSAPKDKFEGVPFAVLGLGDTNYDKFCCLGKGIDKRLNELGGKRVLGLKCADEATDLEEVVEAWKEEIAKIVIEYK